MAGTFAGAAGGSGVYNLSGTADLNTGNFIAGDGGGSVGEINVSGNALVHANNEIWVGNGGNANGTLNITPAPSKQRPGSPSAATAEPAS